MSPTITAIDIVIAFAVAAILARVLKAVVFRWLDAGHGQSSERLVLRARANRLVRLSSLLLFGTATVIAISVLLERFELRGPFGTSREIADRLVRIAFIIAGAFVMIRAGHLSIDFLQHNLGRGRDSDLEWDRRASTLAGILGRIVNVVVTLIALMMILGQLRLDVMPILTGAGIAGLAVGFGAQNLVRDAISGFFLILEDQVRVGDSARINGVSGTVEDVHLRTIVLRDVEGAAHVFPNGTITALANLSKHYAYAVVDVRVRSNVDITQVLQTLRDIGTAMRQDPEWGSDLMGDLEVNGVESLTEAFANVRVRFKTPPLRQGPVANEVRRRVMVEFAARKIRPFC